MDNRSADVDVEYEEGYQNFNNYFGLYDKTTSQIFYSLIYYSFTTLSTVGFGDYHPRGNSERIIGAFLMLFGASITSYIMDGLSTMMQKFLEFNKAYEENSQLSFFIKTLEHFNYSRPLDAGMLKTWEIYFSYRWSNNRNLAISTEEDIFMLEQLPKVV